MVRVGVKIPSQSAVEDRIRSIRPFDGILPQLETYRGRRHAGSARALLEKGCRHQQDDGFCPEVRARVVSIELDKKASIDRAGTRYSIAAKAGCTAARVTLDSYAMIAFIVIIGRRTNWSRPARYCRATGSASCRSIVASRDDNSTSRGILIPRRTVQQWFVLSTRICPHYRGGWTARIEYVNVT